MVFETLLLVGSCHGEPAAADGVLHLAHKLRILRDLKLWIEFRKFLLVFVPSLWVVDECTILDLLVCLALCNCALAVATGFTIFFVCLSVSRRICKVARTLDPSWQAGWRKIGWSQWTLWVLRLWCCQGIWLPAGGPKARQDLCANRRGLGRGSRRG